MFRNILLTGLVGCALSANAMAVGNSENEDNRDNGRRRHRETVNIFCEFARPPGKAVPPGLCAAGIEFTTRFETRKDESRHDSDSDSDDERGNRRHHRRFREEFFRVVCPSYTGPISSFTVRREFDGLLGLGLDGFLGDRDHRREDILAVIADDLSSQVLIQGFRDEDGERDFDTDFDFVNESGRREHREHQDRERHHRTEHPALLRHISPILKGWDVLPGVCRISRRHTSRARSRSPHKAPAATPTVVAAPQG